MGEVIAFAPRPKPTPGGTLRIVLWPTGEGVVEFAIGIQHPGERYGRFHAYAASMSEARMICAKWPGYQVLDLTTPELAEEAGYEVGGRN